MQIWLNKQLLIRALLVSALWSLPASIRASISVSQTIDRTDMAFEDTVGFQVAITWDGPAHAYRFDKPFRLQADRLKVARFSSKVISSGSGPGEITTKTFDYKLTPNLSGVGTIKSLEIQYLVWPDSTVGMLVTDPVTVAIAEPKPPELIEEGGVSAGWIAVIVVIAVGLGVGTFAMIKRKAPEAKIQSPGEAFLMRLTVIGKESGMDLKKFQTGLYKSLVEYVQSKYAVDLAGGSADAIIAALNKVERSQSVRDTLAGWLMRAEKEKYAPVPAAPGEVTRLESEIRQFFEKLT